MTIWRPSLNDIQGPAYQRLADAISRDVEAGRLASGDRLPPQRELADALGLTVGTITRAYQIASRRGLIAGEVGRGTYVQALPGGREDDLIDLSLNAMPPHAHIAELASRLDPAPGMPRASLLEYPSRAGHAEHREAGARWIARRGPDVTSSQVMVTVGAQHALLVALAAVASSGDAILVEELTYSGVLGAARLLGLRPVPVAIDAQGLRADALENAARASLARVVVVQPSIHNPTGVTMTGPRRREILSVVERLGLTVVEDDTYGFLVPDLRPFVCDMDGRWVFVTGLSKSLAPGYRTGFLAASPALVDRAAAALWASAIAASPIAVSLAASLIADGTADRIVEWKKAEVRARNSLARELLPDLPAAISAASPHVWLPLPRPWRAGAFTAAARARGILLGASETFLAQAGATPRAVRICLLPPRSRDRLETALRSLADLVAGAPSSEPTV
jgi:DNA-binding transcriptional MocR family regulator